MFVRYTKSMKSSKGVTLVEVLVSLSMLGIILVIISSIITLFFGSSGTVLNTTRATYLAEEGVELARFIRDDDWNEISSLTTDTAYYFEATPVSIGVTTTPQSIDEFTRSFTVSDLERDGNGDFVVSGGTSDPGGRVLTVTVTWGTESVELQSLITNIHNI